MLIKTHNIGKVVYSSTGLAGGILGGLGVVAAPFTGGASLALIGVGTALGVSSTAADLTHNVVKSSKISTQCENAQKKLRSHDQVCKYMNEKLEMFQVGMETLIENPFFNRTNRNALELLSKSNKLIKKAGQGIKVMKGLRGGAGIVAKGVSRRVFVVGIVTETVSLIKSISNLNKDKLCEEANLLNDTIIQLNDEYDQLDDFFKQNHNTYA